MNTGELRAELERAQQNGIFPGYALAVLEADTTAFSCGGAHTYETNALNITPDTVFDVASLTKIISPMAVAQRLIERGDLSLDTRVADMLPEYTRDEWKQQATLRHLLTYTLEFDRSQYQKHALPMETAESITQNTLAYRLATSPGTSYYYSNLTMFILTHIIEQVSGVSLPRITTALILNPLGMSRTSFTPLSPELTPVPPTEITDERGVVVGDTHDEFTYYLERGGRYSGAAGLFASVRDIARFMHACLYNQTTAGETLFSPTLRNEWTNNQYPNINHPTPLAWGDFNNTLLPSPPHTLVSKGGFTGCFMVMDLEQHRGLALLSNQTYPTRPVDSEDFTALKQRMIAAVTNQ